jgi:hypothetical protein
VSFLFYLFLHFAYFFILSFFAFLLFLLFPVSFRTFAHLSYDSIYLVLLLSVRFNTLFLLSYCRKRAPAVDLALLRTLQKIHGTVALLPPPGYKPKGTTITLLGKNG